MAKLRKMLGHIDDPPIVSLMRLIETQSKATLIRWAVDYAALHFLPVYERHFPNDKRLYHMIASSKAYLDGDIALKQLKPIFKEGQQIARELEECPAAQAAARAVSTACSTIQTMTNSLGFTFYGAAAVVYDRLGFSEKPEIYDQAALTEFERMLDALKNVAVPNESNPIKIEWNC